MNTFRSILLAGIIGSCLSLSLSSQSLAQESTAQPSNKVVLKSEVEWSHLNPKRGDLAPSAGTLWGNRNGIGATGFLLKPANRFQSPPHIHNVSYRGIVIQGFIHNDDPEAARMWMPAGSFWTQPKGEVHITAAKGSDVLAYIEIERGPYLVHPQEQFFASGDRPINVAPTNIVWLNASDINWITTDNNSDAHKGVQAAYLWGDTQEGKLRGTLIKVPAQHTVTIQSHGSTFGSVVIKGHVQYQFPGQDVAKDLEPGSYFSSKGDAIHRVSADSEEESIIYVRTNGRYEISSDQANITK